MDSTPVPEQWRISDDFWLLIEPLIPKRKNTHPFGGGKPPRPDRDCMDAISFVLRTGCQWKALDATRFCPGSTAHDRFQLWVERGVFLAMWEAGLMLYDELEGIDWSWLSMDGCMTKAPLGGEKDGEEPHRQGQEGRQAKPAGRGRGRPGWPRRRGANRNDMKMVEATLESVPVERPRPTRSRPQGMCMDKGYDYGAVRETVAEFGFTAHIRARGEEAEKIKREAGSKARRWVVERTHSWINRFRGVLIRWNKKARNYIAMLHFAFALIAFNRC